MRRGFTLFEVVVALGLSIALMTMVGFAMQFYAQQLNVRDSEARRTQLARSILRMIAEDLQACIYPEKFDSSQLAEVLASASGGEASSGGSSASADTDVTIEDADVDSLDATTDDDFSTSLLSTLKPGLIGNQYQIQFDVSRLPRLEEYLPMLTDPTQQQGIEDIPSDVKTVSYYVQQAGLSGVNDAIEKLKTGGLGEPSTGGLVRRALSREITGFASESGDIVRLTQTGDLIASEVVQIEFAYFDGSQWIYEWDSDEYEALPMAVQIRLTMKNGDFVEDDAMLAQSADASGTTGVDVYDLIVKLPMAQPIPLDEETDEDLSAAGI